MDVLGFTQTEIKALCCVLASIYHLGGAGATTGKLSPIIGHEKFKFLKYITCEESEC